MWVVNWSAGTRLHWHYNARVRTMYIWERYLPDSQPPETLRPYDYQKHCWNSASSAIRWSLRPAPERSLFVPLPVRVRHGEPKFKESPNRTKVHTLTTPTWSSGKEPQQTAWIACLGTAPPTKNGQNVAAVNRFSVFWFDPNPVKGSELSKIRPAIVISPDEMNDFLHTVLVIPLTTTKINWPFRVPVQILGQTTHAACDQIRVVDKSRLKEHISQLPKAQSSKVLSVIQTMFA
jgi:mRNA interferase MazF